MVSMHTHHVSSSRFVPTSRSATVDEIHRLVEFLKSSRHLLILTGAGASTESGIPDYRSPLVGMYARTNYKPIQFQQFVASSATRQRYWCRNFMGWSKYSQLQPNAVHHVLAKWERRFVQQGREFRVVTQNVDHLHQKAGSQSVLDLHGSLHEVHCLHCHHTFPRKQMQTLLEHSNPGFLASVATDHKVAPDGDVILPDDVVRNFVVPTCPSCSAGVLKPQIVFFGDNVPPLIRDQSFEWCDQSDRLLCIGTTLHTFSSYRLALRMRKEEHRKRFGGTLGAIGIVNIGPTRADEMAQWKIESRAGPLLMEVDSLLSRIE